MKSAVSLVGYAIALVVAFSVGSSVSPALYSTIIRDSNIKKIDNSLSNNAFVKKLDEYLESLGYGIIINPDETEKILKTGKDIDTQLYKYINNINGRKVAEEEPFMIKLHEGYGAVIKEITAKQLSKYAAESAGESITKDSSGIDELGPLIMEENQKKAAAYIADNYVAPAYINIIRLLCFVVLLIVVIIFSLSFIKAFTGESGTESASMRIIAGFIGIGKGCIMTFAAAALIRLWVIMGSNEMLFFNFEAIDKTFIFKYFYNLVLKM